MLHLTTRPRLVLRAPHWIDRMLHALTPVPRQRTGRINPDELNDHMRRDLGLPRTHRRPLIDR